jgi:D-galactose 1-dehydrogenase
MKRIAIVVVGFGKIARHAHAPALTADSAYELAAIVDPSDARYGETPAFASLDDALISCIAFDACVHCTPPAARFESAMRTIHAGLHTLLEKPPAASVHELAALQAAAKERGVCLMTAWHAQANESVARARAWLADKTIQSVRINWRENVRKWHPGQQWIWRRDGFGVFDTGINGLSIATRILPFMPRVIGARMDIPFNRESPIAAEITFANSQFEMSAYFDWRETGDEVWDVVVTCAQGVLTLSQGGRTLAIDGRIVGAHDDQEYAHIYRHFSRLIATKSSDVDAAPLQIVEDAFSVAQRHSVEPFTD